MASREGVRALLRQGLDYESAAAALGIGAGVAYMVATGLPADRSDHLGEEREGAREGSTQLLAEQPPGPEVDNRETLAWLRRRAQADPGMRGGR